MTALLILLTIGLLVAGIQHLYSWKYANYFWLAYLVVCGWIAIDIVGVDRETLKALVVALTVVVGMGALEEYFRRKKNEP